MLISQNWMGRHVYIPCTERFLMISQELRNPAKKIVTVEEYGIFGAMGHIFKNVRLENLIVMTSNLVVPVFTIRKVSKTFLSGN